MDWASYLIEPVIFSGLGGLCYSMLSLLELKNKKASKKIDFKKPRFYISMLIYVGIALIIGAAYFKGKEEVNLILSMQVGVSSPLILRAMGEARYILG